MIIQSLYKIKTQVADRQSFRWTFIAGNIILVIILTCMFSGCCDTALKERQKRQEDRDALNQIPDIQTLLDPINEADLIMMIGSSRGMGKSAFYTQERPILESLVRQYALVHPDRVRLAAITFAVRTDTVFDYISASSAETINKCELFYGGENSIWGKIQYFDDFEDNRQTEMLQGLNTAGEIFASGKQ